MARGSPRLVALPKGTALEGALLNAAGPQTNTHLGSNQLSSGNSGRPVLRSRRMSPPANVRWVIGESSEPGCGVDPLCQTVAEALIDRNRNGRHGLLLVAP